VASSGPKLLKGSDAVGGDVSAASSRSAALTESACVFTSDHWRQLKAANGSLQDAPVREAGSAVWVPQHVVSRLHFQQEGVEMLGRIEAGCGQFFVWSPAFSNAHDRLEISEPPITVDGRTYAAGVEAYFQHQKYLGTHLFEKLRQQFEDCATPMEAYELGRAQAKKHIRPDWEKARVDVMRVAVRAKFSQHHSHRDLLMSTHPHPLGQIKPSDSFWGSGSDGSGQNWLARLIQAYRDELMTSTSASAAAAAVSNECASAAAAAASFESIADC
jgi:ribA/ribD-fused uncharacterized protein